MFETLMWLFVVSVWLSKWRTAMRWYLVYKCRWVGYDLKRDADPIDGCHTSHADAASQIAAKRNDYRSDERLVAEMCCTVEERLKASDLNDRHTVDWFTPSEFVEWMQQPAFEGEQDKYSRLQ